MKVYFSFSSVKTKLKSIGPDQPQFGRYLGVLQSKWTIHFFSISFLNKPRLFSYNFLKCQYLKESGVENMFWNYRKICKWYLRVDLNKWTKRVFLYLSFSFFFPLFSLFHSSFLPILSFLLFFPYSHFFLTWDPRSSLPPL